MQELGRMAEARSHFQAALDQCQEIYGEEHPHTATAANNLGSALQSLGELAQARQLFEQALAVDRSIDTDPNPDSGSWRIGHSH